MVALQAAIAVALCVTAKTQVTVVTAGSKTIVRNAIVRVPTPTAADPARPVGKPTSTDPNGVADLGDLSGLTVINAIVQRGTYSGAAEIRDIGQGFPPMTAIEVVERPFVLLPPPK